MALSPRIEDRRGQLPSTTRSTLWRAQLRRPRRSSGHRRPGEGRPRRRRSARPDREALRPPRERAPSRSTTQGAPARPAFQRRRIQRTGVEPRLRGRSPWGPSERLRPPRDVDGRVQDHWRRRAPVCRPQIGFRWQMSTNFASRARPAELDFSGWKLDPPGCPSTTHEESALRIRPCPRRPRGQPGALRERMDEIRRVCRSPRRRRSAMSFQRTGSQPMCGTLRRWHRKRSRHRRGTPDPGPRRAPRWSRRQLHLLGRSRAGALGAAHSRRKASRSSWRIRSIPWGRRRRQPQDRAALSPGGEFGIGCDLRPGANPFQRLLDAADVSPMP